MRGSMLSSVVVLAVVLACASNVSAEKESDLVGFSINVPGTNNQVADDRGVKDVKVEPVEQPRFQEVNAGASSQQLAMADRQALAQVLGESASEVPAGAGKPKTCPHWTQTKELANAPEDRRNPGAFLRTNTNENQELWLIGGWAADGESYKTYDEIYKLDTKADMNGAGGAGWKKVTPKFIAGFDLSQNKVNRAKAASVWLSDNGKSGDFVVFAAGTDAKKNEKGEGVVYHIDARSHAVSVAPMKLNQPTGQKKPDARVGATLTRATANTALLFGGVSVQSQDTLGDSFN